MGRISFLLFLVVITSGFNSRNQEIRVETNTPLREDSIFLRTCTELIKIDLPLFFDCNNLCCNPCKLNSNQQVVISQYLPEGLSFVGVLEIDKFITLLGSYNADNLIPVIITLDLTGKVINEKAFHTGYCGELEKNYKSYQSLLIDRNLQITYKDSSVTDKIETINGETVISNWVELKKEHYIINEFGIFVNN